MCDSGSQVRDSKRLPSSGVLYHKLWKGFTDVSGKVLSPSSRHKTPLPDDRGKRFLRHTGKLQLHSAASFRKR